MTPLFRTDCSKPWEVNIEDHTWPYFANPLTLFLVFVMFALDYTYRLNSKVGLCTNFGAFITS